jgi:subtilisin family serine protease
LDTLGSSAAAGGAALPADAVVSNRIEFSSFKGFTVDVGSTVDPGALSRRAVMDRRLQLIACLEGLKRTQIIEYYEEDVLGSAAAIQQEVPSYGLSRVSQRNFNVETRYHYPDDGGRNSVVYILDSGVRVSHPDFGGRVSSCSWHQQVDLGLVTMCAIRMKLIPSSAFFFFFFLVAK